MSVTNTNRIFIVSILMSCFSAVLVVIQLLPSDWMFQKWMVNEEWIMFHVCIMCVFRCVGVDTHAGLGSAGEISLVFCIERIDPVISISFRSADDVSANSFELLLPPIDLGRFRWWATYYHRARVHISLPRVTQYRIPLMSVFVTPGCLLLYCSVFLWRWSFRNSLSM